VKGSNRLEKFGGGLKNKRNRSVANVTPVFRFKRDVILAKVEKAKTFLTLKEFYEYLLRLLFS
jgi:hypothetical protein